MFDEMPLRLADAEMKGLLNNAARVLHHIVKGALKPIPSNACQFDERARDSKAQPVEPALANVTEFLVRSVQRAEFTAATVVGIVIIFKRVCAACSVHVFNWRILLLLSILLAQKVIDDKSLGTNQFKELFAYATRKTPSVVLATPDIVKMELDLLDLLEYRVNVSSAEHAAWYCTLRGV